MKKLLQSVLVVLLVAGCPRSNPPSSDCSGDGDCGAKQRCADGVCQFVQCTREEDCPEGDSCQDYQCKPKHPCTNHEQCPAMLPYCDVANARCVACLPNCQDLECGPDPVCHKSCGSCGSGTCQDGHCQCQSHASLGCKDNAVWWFDSCGRPESQQVSCPQGCANGQCQGCTPSCGTRTCGPDPVCGQSCGTCSNGTTCGSDGTCGCTPGATRCSEDGFGFETCGAVSGQSGYSFGQRIPCAAGQACSSQTGRCEAASCLRTEVMVLLDRSSSMTESGAWNWVTSGLTALLDTFAHANAMGMRQFPMGSTGCSVGDVVPLAMDNADTITSSFTAPTISSATPIGAAMQGLETQFGDPNDGEAVLLMTDGDETCGSPDATVDGASTLWRRGIRVYVIAVTTTANRSFLNRVATAGGTGSARLATTPAELTTALSGVMQDLVACQCTPGTPVCANGQIGTCSANGTSTVNTSACAAGSCANRTACQPVCSAGALRCQNGVISQCAADAQSWEHVKDCASSVCHDAWSCESICSTGDTNCRDGVLSKCSVDGQSWERMRDCEAGTCASTTLCTKVCTPRERQCTNGQVQECSAEGESWRVLFTCTEGCEAGTAGCHAQCTPGTQKCTDGFQQTCNWDGQSWQIEKKCSNGCDTAGTVCKTLCTAGALECSNNVTRQCNALGSAWNTVETCTQGCETDGTVCHKRCATTTRECIGRDVFECTGTERKRVTTCAGECNQGTCVGCGRSSRICDPEAGALYSCERTGSYVKVTDCVECNYNRCFTQTCSGQSTICVNSVEFYCGCADGSCTHSQYMDSYYCQSGCNSAGTNCL